MRFCLPSTTYCNAFLEVAMKRMLVVFMCISAILCQTSATQGEGPSDQAKQKQAFALEVKTICNAYMLSFERVYGAVKYSIQKSEATGELVPRFKTKETTFLDNSVKEGQSYKYQVTAIDEEGNEIGTTPIVQARPYCKTEKCEFVLEYQAGNVVYKVDGVEQSQMDVAPEITNGRMFLVIRYVTKEVGAELEWIASERKITVKTVDGKVIELWIDKPIAKIGDKQVQIDPNNDKVVPYVKSGRTLMPMRFVAENLGSKKIDYDSKQSLAKLLMRKPNCFEPNFLTFTYEQYDFIRGKMVCSDPLKAKFLVSVPSDQMTVVKGLAKGDRVLVMASDAKSVADVITISASVVLKMDRTGIVALNGRITKITDAEVKIKNCEGNEVALKNMVKPLSMMSFATGDAVKVAVKSDSAIDITRVLMEQLCSQDPESTVLLKVRGNICEEGIVNGLSFTKEEVTSKTLFYQKENPDFCSLTPQGCYNVTYSEDPLGRPLAKRVEKIDCPCDVFVGNPDRSLFAVSGDTVVFKYKATNSDKSAKTITPIIDTKGFKGKVDVNPRSAQVDPDRFVQFEVACTVDEDFKGKTLLRYGAKCDETSNVKDAWFVVYEPLFMLSDPMGSFMVPKESPIIFTFSVKNSTIATMNCKPIVTSDDFIGSLSVDPTQELLRPMGTSEFRVRAKWDNKVPIGKTATVKFGVKCGSRTEMKEVRLEAFKKGPIVTIARKFITGNGSAEINGSVDWNGFERGSINVRWGDGESGEYGDFPLTHVYEKPGDYFVEIWAVAATGEVGSSTTRILHTGPKPIINVTNIYANIRIYNYHSDWELHIEGSVDWLNFKKKRIIFKWGDGSEDVIGDFPQVHTYRILDIVTFRIKILAETETGEVGEFNFIME